MIAALTNVESKNVSSAILVSPNASSFRRRGWTNLQVRGIGNTHDTSVRSCVGTNPLRSVFSVMQRESMKCSK